LVFLADGDAAFRGFFVGAWMGGMAMSSSFVAESVGLLRNAFVDNLVFNGKTGGESTS